MYQFSLTGEAAESKKHKSLAAVLFTLQLNLRAKTVRAEKNQTKQTAELHACFLKFCFVLFVCLCVCLFVCLILVFVFVFILSTVCLEDTATWICEIKPHVRVLPPLNEFKEVVYVACLGSLLKGKPCCVAAVAELTAATHSILSKLLLIATRYSVAQNLRKLPDMDEVNGLVGGWARVRACVFASAQMCMCL